MVKEDKCIGCKMCTNVCPMGAIVYEPRSKCVIKCDLCEGDPMCVKFCPTDAIKYEEIIKTSFDKKRRAGEERLHLLSI